MSNYIGNTPEITLRSNMPVKVISSDYVVQESDLFHQLLVNCYNGSVTIDIPENLETGFMIDIKKIDNTDNVVIINPYGSQTIDNLVTYTLDGRYYSISILYDSDNWHILSQSGLLAASETRKGTVEYSDDTEALGLTSTDTALTPATLGTIIDSYGSQSYSINGFNIFPNGFILQWGQISIPVHTTRLVTFPTVFPNQILQGISSRGSGSAYDSGAAFYNLTNSNARMVNPSAASSIYRYMVWGY